MLELRVVDGEEGTIVTGILEWVDQTDQCLYSIGTQRGRAGHHCYGLWRCVCVWGGGGDTGVRVGEYMCAM